MTEPHHDSESPAPLQMPPTTDARTPPLSLRLTPPASDAEMTKVKKGQRPKFSAAQDLVILREVGASKAYIAAYGNKRLLYLKAADACNRNPSFSAEKVDYKSVQDRYIRLQKDFYKKDRRESLMSGIGGEVGEADELLSMMKDARDTKEAEENLEKAERKEREERKVRAGAALMRLATSRGTSATEDSDSEVVEVVNGERSAGCLITGSASRASWIGSQSRHDAEMAKVTVQKEHLDLERERMWMEYEEKRRREKKGGSSRKRAGNLDCRRVRPRMSWSYKSSSS